MLHCSNGLIWYSARCWLLFWYARQSVLMEDDCSRVWRQFDGLWMRAHSVPLTAQDNALCSLLPLSHNLAQHNTPHWTASHNIRIYNTAPVLLPYKTSLNQVLFLCRVTKRTIPNSNSLFSKIVVFRNEQIGAFLLFVCSAGNSGTVSVYRGIVRVERGPHLGCSAQSSQSLWVF